jgi:hypothetical protein
MTPPWLGIDDDPFGAHDGFDDSFLEEEQRDEDAPDVRDDVDARDDEGGAS